MEPAMKDVLDRVEQVRLTLALNKSRFAKGFGMHPQTYNNFHGKQASRPSIELIMGVCKEYRAKFEWLLTGEGDQGEWAIARDLPDFDSKSPQELIADNAARRGALEILGHGNLRAAEELRKAEEEARALLRPHLALAGKAVG